MGVFVYARLFLMNLSIYAVFIVGEAVYTQFLMNLSISIVFHFESCRFYSFIPHEFVYFCIFCLLVTTVCTGLSFVTSLITVLFLPWEKPSLLFFFSFVNDVCSFLPWEKPSAPVFPA